MNVWLERACLALLTAWFVLTVVYNAFRTRMYRPLRRWDIALLIPGWQLFSGMPRNLRLFVRGTKDQKRTEWREICLLQKSWAIGGLWEFESQNVYVAYRYMKLLEDMLEINPDRCLTETFPYRGLRAYVNEQSEWQNCDAVEFQIVERFANARAGGHLSAPARIVYRSPPNLKSGQACGP